MPLYTFMAEFKGGTYLSQVSAPAVDTAVRAWARNIKTREVAGLGEALKQRLVAEVNDIGDKPTPVNGLRNTWCISFRGFLVHIVETSAKRSAR